MTMWAYVPLIYLARVHHPRHLLYTYCSASFPPSFAQWAHTFLFYDTVGLCPSFTDTVSTTLAIYCTQTVQLQFLLYLHSGPIPPHFTTQWAYTPYFLTHWAPPSSSTVHRLSSLSSSLTCTVVHTSSFYDRVGLYPHLLTQ